MQNNDSETMRLSKRMAQLGLCSRREADSYIEQGWVKVNGQTAVLGQKVTERDRIDLNKQAHEKQAARVTILLNKPVGYVSAQAEKGYKSAAELITAENHWEGDDSRIPFSEKHKFGLAPAGRLDIDSVGLLVLTQDGRIAKQLIGENSSSEKEYLVRVRGKLDDKGLALLNHGLSLDGEKLRPRQSRMAKRRPVALYFATRQKTPNPPHVRTGRPARRRFETHPHGQSQTRQTAAGQMALFTR